MPEKITIDPIQYTQGLYNIACQISVSGPANVHNMDLVLQGLKVLQQSLVPPKEEPEKEAEG